MAYDELIYSVEHDNVAVITLNRPEAMNALTGKTHTDLEQAIDEADKDDAIRVIVFTGAGRGFCSGTTSRRSSSGAAPRRRVRMVGQTVVEPAPALPAASDGIRCDT